MRYPVSKLPVCTPMMAISTMPILSEAGIEFSGEPEIFEVRNTYQR